MFGEGFGETSREEPRVKLGKVSFHGDTRDCLRPHSIEKWIEVDKAKVELISNIPTPKCVRDMRSFLGHAGFYRRFTKDFSVIARPLCNFLAKDVPFAW